MDYTLFFSRKSMAGGLMMKSRNRITAKQLELLGLRFYKFNEGDIAKVLQNE